MKRDVQNYLLSWKKSATHKPILMRGARQVGKSWLAHELGKTFDNFVVINFEENPHFIDLFSESLSPSKLLPLLEGVTGVDIVAGTTLLFFDEIQLCPQAIVSLRYFYEQYPSLHVIGAGSLIEFELTKISTPVGRIEFLYIYPLSFFEYLCAVGKEKKISLILAQNISSPLHFVLHTELLKEVKEYMLIGGMPEVVKEFTETHNYQQCQKIQTSIIETYKSDFMKYSKVHELPYLELLFNALPTQIGGKFKYSNVSNDIKSRELSNGLSLLEQAGLFYKVYHSSSSGVPLGAQVNLKKFKMLFFDIGLTNRILGVDLKKALLAKDVQQINNGTIAEAFVGLELIVAQSPLEKSSLYYWHREKKSSNAEIDYVIEHNEKVIPLEVKSGSTGSLKSMHLFLEDKKSSYGVKISSSNFSLNDTIQTIPFYAIKKLFE